MFEHPNQKINTYEESKYLKQGTQTKITPLIKEIVSEYKNQPIAIKLTFMLSFVKLIPLSTHSKKEVFRKRSASKIILDNFVTGCTDENIVFIALSRALNISTKYIETVDIESLTKLPNQRGSYNGHVYSSIYNKSDDWQIIDVTKKRIGVYPKNDKRIILREGLDSWGIGVKDFDSLKKIIDNYREYGKYQCKYNCN